MQCLVSQDIADSSDVPQRFPCLTMPWVISHKICTFADGMVVEAGPAHRHCPPCIVYEQCRDKLRFLTVTREENDDLCTASTEYSHRISASRESESYGGLNHDDGVVSGLQWRGRCYAILSAGLKIRSAVSGFG